VADTPDCPDPDLLTAFHAGALSADEAAAVERHMDRCPACRRILVSLVPRADDAGGDGIGPGHRVDHFVIIRLLGSGAMGRVFLAQDIRLGRKVALKVVDSTSKRESEQLLGEARTTARFNHPNIVTVYDVGTRDLTPYLALEYVDGQTLRQRLRQQAFAAAEVIRLGYAVAAALCEAHRHGILHRDLKPANVMLDRDGRIKVLDFGLAHPVPTTLERSDRPGVIRGTPYYWAPELWRGEPPTAASDIWSLGVMLHELAVGRRPFVAPDARALRRRILSGEVPPLDGVPASLSQLVLACLDPEPNRRPTAGDLASRLHRLLRGGEDPRAEREAIPYMGLQAFDEGHAHSFFGRDEETTAIAERLRREPFLALVGPSGAGKSSLVQAGLIPRLRERGPLTVIQLRPGGQPFAALATQLWAVLSDGDSSVGSSVVNAGALPSSFARLARTLGKMKDIISEADLARRLRAAPGLLNPLLQQVAARHRANVLLFVDQIEELSTLVRDPGVRESFVSAVSAAADDPEIPVRAVCTLREEFLTRLASSREARAALGRVVLLGPPPESSLEEILVRPVEAMGYAYEDLDLVREMVAEVQDEAACLPLLAFAGRRLWDRRDRQRRLLRRDAYEAMGGVAGALARHADSLLAGLAQEEVQQARTIFLRLVTPDGTRRALPPDDLLEGLPEGAKVILDRLVEARLVTSSRPPGQEMQIELVHEALITVWMRLRRWLEESREELVFLEELDRAAELWERRGRRDEALWQDDSLRDARRVLSSLGAQVPERARRFVAASLHRQRQRGRRKRLLVAAAFGLLAAVAVVLVFKEEETRREQVRAVRLKAIAEGEGARTALLRGEMVEARAKLRSSLEVRDSALGRALFWRLQREPLVWRKELGGFPYSISFAPDATSLAAACQDKTVYLLDTRSLAVRLLRGHAEQAMTVAHSPDGRMLASGDWSGEVRLWQIESGRARTLGRHTDRVWSVRFSPDGHLLASVSQRRAQLWDTRSGAKVRAFPVNLSRFGGLSFSPSGDRLAAGCRDGTVRIFRVDTGRPVRALSKHLDDVRGVSFAGDGRRLASASLDRTARIWDTRTGATLSVLRGHRSGVIRAEFSPDGRQVATGALDQTVRLWDARQGRLERVINDHTGSVYSVTYSPDGRLLASAGFERVIRVRDLTVTPARRRTDLDPHTSSTYAVDVSPDGRLVVSASQDKTARIWSVATGRIVRVLRCRDAVFGAAFSPDGRLVATGAHLVALHDVKSGARVRELRGNHSGVSDVTFSPDGERVVAGIDDGTVWVWSLRDGAILHTFRGHEDAVNGVSFSPDGTLVASASRDSTVRIWDLRHGRHRVLRGHAAGVWGARFSPDGRRLYTSSEDHTVRVWEVATGRQHILGRHPSRVNSLDVNPAGTEAAAAGAEGAIRIWRTDSGAQRVLRGHRGEVNFIRYSRDGSLLVSSSDDETVRLWDPESGRPRWRAPVLLGSPPELLTHRGWELLAPGARTPRRDAAWRRAVSERARHAVEAPPALLCIQTHDGSLELWDRRADRRLLRRAMPDIRQLQPLPDGCLVLSGREPGGRAAVVRASKVEPLPREGVGAVAWDRGRLIVATRREVTVSNSAGRRLRRYPCDPGVAAMAQVGEWIALGNRDGNIDLVPLSGGTRRAGFSFENTPSSEVVRILDGPAGTLIAGFANGTVGIWSMANGVQLHRVRLHGPALHLLLRDGRLYVATELGDHLVLDLRVFTLPYCELIRKLWKTVPVVWSDGLPRIQPPPADHHCSLRGR
jgi:WD40 repeat protein